MIRTNHLLKCFFVNFLHCADIKAIQVLWLPPNSVPVVNIEWSHPFWYVKLIIINCSYQYNQPRELFTWILDVKTFYVQNTDTFIWISIEILTKINKYPEITFELLDGFCPSSNSFGLFRVSFTVESLVRIRALFFYLSRWHTHTHTDRQTHTQTDRKNENIISTKKFLVEIIISPRESL